MPHAAKNVRPAAVAGTFYPAVRERLVDDVDRFLAEARTGPGRPKALVVPHAGYLYSGPIAGTAYALVQKMSPAPTRVVLLGPAHHVAFDGLALPEADALETPLGTIAIDAEAVALVKRMRQVVRSDFVHEREHSLEVQLPFLQCVLPHFSLVPFAVGQAQASAVAEVLEVLWGGPETLLLVSTDLSHYLPYDEARQVDARTASAVARLDFAALDGDDACGCAALCGLLLAARSRGLSAQVLDLRNSGDTAGDRHRVVGYGAFGFFEPGSPAVKPATPLA